VKMSFAIPRQVHPDAVTQIFFLLMGKPFIDDVAVKPASQSMFLDKNGVPEEVAPGIRKFVLEAIISVDRVLADIERAGDTISGAKSEFLMEKLKVVVYICGSNGRTPEDTKVQRITNWPACQTVTEIKGCPPPPPPWFFITGSRGICVYKKPRYPHQLYRHM